MQEDKVIQILENDLNFSSDSIDKLKVFSKLLISANQKHNLISKKTEIDIWHRHILDSAQLVKFINFSKSILADLGSGAGFPGIVLAIYNKNSDFHVKLYEKSPVKKSFLEKIIKKCNLKVEVLSDVYDGKINADFVVCRAFKKLEKIIQVSREITKKPHKLIVLKGQNAQEEVNKAFKSKKYHYKLENSITNSKSKIVIINFKQ